MAWGLLQHRAALLLFCLCTCCIAWTSHTKPTHSSTAARATIPCNGAIGKTVVQQFSQVLAAKLPAGFTPSLGPLATTIQVSSWAELTQAVQQAKQSSTSTGWTLFKLLNDVIAINAVQLLPGMVVLGSSAAGAGGKAAVQCGEGTPSAFVVNMTARDGRDVILSNLHVNSCSNSAIVVNGTYKPQAPLAKPPPGLIVTHSSFSSNAASKEGGAMLALKAAVYLYNSKFSGNSAAKSGGAIRISSGLLVAQNGMFRGNRVGLMSKSVELDKGSGSAVFATETAIAFFNTIVTGNAAEAVGGCAVAVTGPEPVLVSGCHFTDNKCRPNRAQSNLQASSTASSSCSDGGGALRVLTDGTAPDHGDPVDCKSSAGGQNAVVIMDSNFTQNEAAGDGVCGGSVMVQKAWLEVHSSSFLDTHGSHFGGALGALSSNVVITDSTFKNVSATQIGGAIQNPAGRLWVFNSSFNDGYAKQSGGCIGSADGVAMQLHSVVFVQCSARVMGGAVWFELISVEPEEPPLFTANNARFLNCASGKEGGALGTNLVTLEVADSEFIMCESYYGGAAVAYSAPIALTNTRFINNTARSGGQGGALYTYGQPTATFTNCSWIGNKAYQGGVLMGGADPGAESEWRFEGCLLERNAASQFGGALWGSGINLTSINTTYVSNTALAGGAIYATGFADDHPLHVTFQDCLFYNNTVAQSGGMALLKTVARVAVQRSNITQNAAKLVAGGLYLQNASGLIEDSSLAGNVAQSAGALMIEGEIEWEPSSFLIRNSQLVQNKAGGSAGAVQLLKGSLTLTDSTISNNYASSAAGGILLLSGSTLNCSMGCVFEGNNATIGAGIAAESAVVQLTASSMSSNWAAGDLVTVATSTGQQDAACGGAVWAESSDVIISGSTFEGNRANLQGGALYLLNSTATIKSTKFSSNQAVGKLLASAPDSARGITTAGGGVYAVQAAAAEGGKRDLVAKDLLIESCTFIGNAAGVGGAIAVTEQGGGVTDSIAAATAVAGDNGRRHLLQNQAGYKNNVQLPVSAGNDLKKTHMSTALSKPTILFYSTLFVNNAARLGSGGSVFIDLVRASININSSNFSSNSAAHGAGAVAALRPASLNMQASSFTFNAATHCGGLLLSQQQQPSVITGCSFTKNKASVLSSTHAGSSNTANRNATGDNVTSDQTSEQGSFGQLPMYSSSGSGGGLCLVAGALVTISASIIRNNVALHGAGLFVQDGRSDSASQQLHGGHPYANSSACQVSITNNTILGPNQLLPGGSGSAYYTTAASIIEVSHNLLVELAGAGDGTSSNGSGTTAMVATNPYRLTGGLVTQQSNTSLLLDSGDSIGAVQLQLQDQLGSSVKSSVLERLTFIAQAVPASPASKSDTQLIGVTSTIVAPGGAKIDSTDPSRVATTSSSASPSSNAVTVLSHSNATENLVVQFDNLELHGAPGDTFYVVFSVKEAPEVAATIVQVELRPCTPGQAVMRGRDTTLFSGCTNCTNPLFSFDPTHPQCYTCPASGTYSKCSGDVLTPADGFWQSHPWSTQLLACPFKPACTRSSSTYSRLTHTSLEWRNTARLTATADRPNLSEVEAQQATLIGTYQHLQCADGYTGNLCGNCARDQRVSQAANRSCQPCQFSKLGSAILFSAVRLLDLAVVLLQVAIVLADRQRRQTYADRDVMQISESVPDGFAEPAQPGVTSYMLKGALVLKEQEAPANPHLVQIEPGTDSIFAMLIEYMQLLSVLRLTRIGEFWRTTAEAVLLALSITPISTYGWMSIECSLPAGLPADSYAYYSTLATTLIPIALTLVVCSTVFAKNAVQAKLRGFLTLHSYPHLVPECLLAASKAITYSYPIVTGSIVGIFSCKTLDAPPTVAGEVVAAQGTYWTKDLDTVCLGRKHAAFMLALGLPMLLLIIAYPVVQALLLARKARRQPDGLYEVKFWTNYSLLYEQYRPRMYLWGCLRDARQLALITLVVVLQSQPDAQIQLVAGWMLALVLLALHGAVAPFKTRLLNALQLCMLASLAFTFYVGVISTVQGVPGAASSALQHIAVLLDVGVVLMLLCVLLWRARLCFDHDNDGKVSWEDVKLTLRKHSIVLCTGATSLLGWCLRRQDSRVAARPLWA